MLTKLILASASPRRKEILKELCKTLIIEALDIDEKTVEAEPDKIVMSLAKLKLGDLPKRYLTDKIVSADTIVFLGKVYGKPTSFEDAVKILQELSGKTHWVYTGFAFYCNDKIYVDYDKCEVKMKNLSASEIEFYLKEYKPFDKAGAYGVQDGYVVESFSGDKNTIVGFPKAKFLALLEELNIEN